MHSKPYPLEYYHWGVTVIAFGLVAYLEEGWIFVKDVFQQTVSGGIAGPVFCGISVPILSHKGKIISLRGKKIYHECVFSWSMGLRNHTTELQLRNS